MIPRRILQTDKSVELSPLGKAASTSVKLLHPEWEYIFFDDRDVRSFLSKEYPQYMEPFDRFRYPIQKVDFFRYLAVYHLGGFYLDTDVLLSGSLAELVDNRCVFPFEELSLSRFLRQRYRMDWEIGNYAFGAEPGHPFLLSVINNCVKAQSDPNWLKPMLAGIPWIFRSDFYVLNTTGPGLLSRTYAENPDLIGSVTVLFPDNVCDRTNWHKFGAYGVHLMNASWRPKAAYLYRRLAGWWELRLRRRLLRQSARLGPRRDKLKAAAQAELATELRA